MSPKVCCPMLDSVVHILKTCAPAQVHEWIIRGTAIPMTAFSSDWRRSNEGAQHQVMNELAVLEVAHTEHDKLVTALHGARSQQSTFVKFGYRVRVTTTLLI